MEPKTFLSRDEWVAKAKADEDMSGIGVRKHVRTAIHIKEPDPETGMNDIGFTISTASVDREGDVISVDGWDINHYLKNPVVLWAHDTRNATSVIGRAVSVSVTDNALQSIDRFTPESVNPTGAMVYRLLKGGFLNATSVGFNPVEWTFNEDHRGYDFLRSELLEHSVVPVPANPDALVMASAAGIDLRPMREWIERMLDHDPTVERFSLIPTEIAERAWKELRNVEGVDIPPLTSMHFYGVSDAGGWKAGNVTTDTTTTPDYTTWTGYGSDLVRSWHELSTGERGECDLPIENETEAKMEEAIKELIEEIKALREDLTKLNAPLETKAPEPDPEEDDLSADELRSMVREVMGEVMTATTGKLPD